MNKLEYFINALCYGSWIRSDRFISNVIKSICYFFHSEKWERRKARALKETGDYRNSVSFIAFSNNFRKLWGLFSFPYIFGISIFLERITESAWIPHIGLVICCFISYWALEKCVFSHNRYIEYFKIFEQKDESWHRKWRIISIIFEILTLIMVFIGLFAVIYIDRLFIINTPTHVFSAFD